MRLRNVCAVVACNALLGAAAFSGCATGSSGLATGSGGSGAGAGPGASSSTTTTTTTTTTTSVSSTTGAGTGGMTTGGTGGQGVGGMISSTTGTAGAGGSASNGCTHDVCTKGAPLDPTCDACTAAVCDAAADPFCCDPTGMWDVTCVGTDVAMFCAAMTCATDAGTPDAGMDAGGMDAGGMDAGGMDAGGMDAGPIDAGPCALTHLVISQVRSRGVAGANDEFIELYNPTTADVTLDSTWKVMGRSTGSTTYTARWTGNGGIIPAHGHYLVTGMMYTQMPARDQALSAGITDAASLVLQRSATQIDAVCYAFDVPTTTAVSAFTCEGTPVSNAPHNNGTTGMSNSDVSFQRLLGGSAGNCVDTDDNATDFAAATPATPRNSSSPAVP